MIIDQETYLEHYGVKGMHWGIRNEEAENYTNEKLHKGLNGRVVPYNPVVRATAVVGGGIVTGILAGAAIPLGPIGIAGASFIGASVTMNIIDRAGQRKIYRMSDARTQWIRNKNPNAPELPTRAPRYT